MKTQDKNSNEPFDKRHYKKKFLLRQHEEHEAEEEIKEFNLDELDTDEDKQTRSKPD